MRDHPETATAPAVSVVMAVRDGERYVAEALESVLGQTLADREVVVVDDGSTDGTPGILERFRARGVRSVARPSGGPAGARNHGVGLTSGALVAFLDHDDRWHPRFLERAVAYLDAHPEAGLVATDAVAVTGDGTPTPYVVRKQSPGPVYTTVSLLEGEAGTILPSAVVARRQALLDAGGFDESLRGACDVDLWLRLSRHTELHRLEDPLVFYRVHASNMSRNILSNAEEILRLLDGFERRYPELPAEVRSSVRRMRGKQFLRLGREALAGSAGPADPGLARRSLARAISNNPALVRAYLYGAIALIPGGSAVYARTRRAELRWQQRRKASRLWMALGDRFVRRRRTPGATSAAESASRRKS